MTASDEALTSSLAMLGGLAETELDQRVTRFQDRLRRLHDDPAEAARIDALAMQAAYGEHDLDIAPGRGVNIHVNGGVVNVRHGEPGEETAARERAGARPGATERDLLQRIQDLETAREETSARSRPQRERETAPWPAFGGGVFIAILAAATVTTALHATATAMTLIASVLAATTALAALVSVLMPWAAFWALIRRGEAHLAAELLSSKIRVPRPRGGEDADAPAVSTPARELGPANQGDLAVTALRGALDSGERYLTDNYDPEFAGAMIQALRDADVPELATRHAQQQRRSGS